MFMMFVFFSQLSKPICISFMFFPIIPDITPKLSYIYIYIYIYFKYICIKSLSHYISEYYHYNIHEWCLMMNIAKHIGNHSGNETYRYELIFLKNLSFLNLKVLLFLYLSLWFQCARKWKVLWTQVPLEYPWSR